MPFIGDDEADHVEQPASVAVEFADREEESKALASSVEFMETVLRGDEDIDAFHHVLSFYGGSGVGKSSLSSRLQAWLEGDLVNDHWGQPPSVSNAHCVRWDLNPSQGEIDVVSMLMSLRAVLPPIPGGWKFLDMALLSFIQSARPGEDLRLKMSNDKHRETLSDAFEALAGDVGGLLDVTTGIASQSVKLLVGLARRKYADLQLRRYPRLAQLIDACNAQGASATPSPELAAGVLKVANQQISQVTDPSRRPLLVIFIDHFEKLQRDDRRNGEVALNHLVAALPQSLFVITGRNRVDWDNPARVALRYSGPRWWPQLVVGADANPRQHRLGMLSEHDTRQVFQRRAARQGFALDDETMQRVCERTGGWPVHIDAICTLAANVSRGTGIRVPPEELDKPLDDVVRRVQENLTERQAKAFRGACLLPYFDDALAAAAAGVDEGDVRSMRVNAMVEPSDDPRWPFRVHDAIREIVRRSSAEVAGGWSANDWAAAAQRAIDHAETRFRAAVATHDDVDTVRAAALAIRIAAENGTWAEWFVPPRDPSAEAPKSAYSASPSEAIQSLLPLRAGHPETDALLRFYAARASRNTEESVAALTELAEGPSAIARHARLWVAYKERARGNTEAAVAALQQLVAEYPGWSIPVGQIGITLNQARRFRDALRYAEGIPQKSQRYVRHNVCLHIGRLTDERVLDWDARTQGSTRYAIELAGARSKWEARTGDVDPDVVMSRLTRAVNAGHPGAQRNCHFALGCLHLGEDTVLSVDLENLEVLDSRAARPSSHLPELLTLRAMLTGSRDDAERAHQLWLAAPRRAGWLPVETYLLELGFAITPEETQWPEPEETIRGPWLEIADDIVSRARRRSCGN